MDIYIVRDGNRIIGASAKLQGAEMLRGDYISHEANLIRPGFPNPDDIASEMWKRTSIENHELRDLED